jgi:hypothetical protein
MPLEKNPAPLYKGIVIDFDVASDLEYAEAIRKALLLLEGVGQALLVLADQESKSSPSKNNL